MERWQVVHGRALTRAVGAVFAVVAIAMLAGCGTSGGFSPQKPVESASAPTSDGFCATRTCIPNFDNGAGGIVRCADGEWSHSGGLFGACSGHGGLRPSAPQPGSNSATASAPSTTPTPPLPHKLPRSHPTPIGSATGTAGAYKVTIVDMTADHGVDLADSVGGPPEFGVFVDARCQEPPDAIVTWRLEQAGGDPLDDGFATCFDGSFGKLTFFTATGCGNHWLVITPVALATDGGEHRASAPLKFEFTTCR